MHSDEDYSKMFEVNKLKITNDPIINLHTSFVKDGVLRSNKIKFKKFEDGGGVFISMMKGHSRATDKKTQMQMIIREPEALKLKAWLNEHYPD